MSSSATPSGTAPAKPARSAGRWAVIGFFALLAVGFLLRLLQNGYHWLGGHSTADVNYKVLTVWCLIYLVVCGGIAAFAYWLPSEEDTPEA